MYPHKVRAFFCPIVLCLKPYLLPVFEKAACFLSRKVISRLKDFATLLIHDHRACLELSLWIRKRKSPKRLELGEYRNRNRLEMTAIGLVEILIRRLPIDVSC